MRMRIRWVAAAAAGSLALGIMSLPVVTSIAPVAGGYHVGVPTKELASAPVALRPGPVSCRDLPISSAVISPTSCWQTGPTGFVVGGSVPSSRTTGEIAVIQGQARSMSRLAGEGSVSVARSSATTACLASQSGIVAEVNLGTGQLTRVRDGKCSVPTGPQAAAKNGGSQTVVTDQMRLLSVSSGAIAPPVSPSYYEYYAYLQQCSPGATVGCPLYQQGQSTYTPDPAGLVILDFGAPCYSTTTGLYGTEMFGGGVCVADASLKELAQAWVRGYESDHGPGTVNITLALGTSNSLNSIDPNSSLSDAEMATSGSDWYQQLVAPLAALSLGAPVTVWAASDIEQSGSGNWYAAGPSLAWVDGYASAAPARYTCDLGESGFMADYGDDVLGGQGSGDGWTAAQVYQAAWGIPVSCVVPEIYYQGMASEWEALSTWGASNQSAGAIAFTGVLTEVFAGSFSPPEGWARLQADTAQQPPIPTLSEIGTSLQGPPPSISEVSPHYGSLGGGTTVTISGQNLLGLSAVDFGDQPATTFTLVSSDQATAVSPAGSAGAVDVVVQTTSGSSSLTAGDSFQYVPAACSSVAVGLAATSAAPGYQDVVSPHATCGPGAQVQYAYFTGPSANGPWTLQQGWTPLSWIWPVPPSQSVAAFVLVWASDGPYSIPQAQSAVQLSVGAACSSVSAGPANALITPGETLTVSAQAQCPAGSGTRYSYFLRSSTQASWTLEAAWIGPSWAVGPLAPGAYQVLTWASDGPLTVPQAQESFNVTVASAAACTGVDVSAPGSVSPGSNIGIVADATCPGGAQAEYSYFTRNGQSGPWTLEDAWTSNTWTWDTASLSPGTYQVLVWASDGPFGVPQAQAPVTVTVGWPSPCSSLTISGPASVPPNDQILIGAQAACPMNSVKYTYFVRPGDTGPWNLVAAWIGNQWLWNDSGLAPGTYQVLVWASDGPYAVPQVQQSISVYVS